MAEYYIAPKSSFDATADAIREKTGSQATIEWTQDGFADAIEDISSGGVSIDDYFTGSVPSGEVVFNQSASIVGAYAISGRKNMTKLTVNVSEDSSHVLANRMVQQNPALITCIFNFGTSNKAGKEYMISDCSALTTVIIRGTMAGCDQSGFRGNSNMKYFDVENCINTLGNNAFYGNTKMDTLIFRQSSIVPVTRQTLLNTPFKSGGTGGTIYIPKTMYDHLGDGTSLDYKNATNWAVWDSYGTITWAQIEGSQYENYYADGTPIPTA